MKKLMFVCSRNRLRSPTAEHTFAGRDGFDVAFAGLNKGADVPLSVELIEWADIIFVMEKIHRGKVSNKFKTHLKNKRLICLDIPDDYEYMQLELVELLEQKVWRLLGSC
ncbi:MAG: low molecular weight protein tyrosine phosphatase family protein [Acidobacteriota bacterium]|nr:low molecular weight protein tyrosine phosphatase family protein [Acidobacteriota bacterium]